MMKLEDALYNWLQAKLVADARPEDGAARETVAFFSNILKEDHRLQFFSIQTADEVSYVVGYRTADGGEHSLRLDKDAAEWLLNQIRANPNFSLDER